MDIDLAKYTKHGHFKLHNGQYNDTFYDIKEMICDGKLDEILWFADENLKKANTYVGIESAGAIIATYVSYMNGYNNMAIITKDNELIGNVVEPYTLIDDVTTSSNSLKKAIEVVGINPKEIFVVVDRREIKANINGIDIKSMFKV